MSARELAARPRVQWAVVFGAGVALRLILFSGYGLGDDPNYFISYFSIYRAGTYNPADPYAMRFGIWVPVVLCMKLLGVTEIGFVGAITAASIVNLALVYLLARQEWERPYALLAMALLAVFPLDVLCSTLFANDIVLSTYCFAAFFLYRKALREPDRTGVRVACAAGSAVLLLFAFVTKPWTLLMAPLFAVEALRHGRRAWLPSLLSGGGFALLGGAYLGWQWLRFGDPLYHITISKRVAIFLPYSRDILLDYPRMLFLPNDYGSRFAGFYPHLLAVLAVVFALRLVRAGKWLFFFALLLLGLAAMPSHRQDGHWVTLVPHIFRYMCLLSIPLCLALTAYLRELFRWNPIVGGAATAVFLVLSVVQCVALTDPSRDAFGEMRRAIAVLRRFPDERVWSDYDFIARFQNFELKRTRFDRVGWSRGETAEKRAAEFASIGESMVVTGGGRLPWYGCYPCIADLGSFQVPPSWTLITTFEGRPLRQYRHEPMRIWRVSRAALRAKELIAERPDAGSRRALLRELGGRGEHEVAAEVGLRLLADSPDDAELAHLTGNACVIVHKTGCATRLLTAALAKGLDGPPAREAIVNLALARAQESDFGGAQRWAAELRRRFPRSPPDPQLVEIESGMAEGIVRYHDVRYPAALRLFTNVLARQDASPEQRRRAAYFAALTLFRMGRSREAVKRATDYRTAYGVDSSWIELRYREAESLRLTDRAAARTIYSELATTYPNTYWAGESSRQLATLDVP